MIDMKTVPSCGDENCIFCKNIEVTVGTVDPAEVIARLLREAFKAKRDVAARGYTAEEVAEEIAADRGVKEALADETDEETADEPVDSWKGTTMDSSTLPWKARERAAALWEAKSIVGTPYVPSLIKVAEFILGDDA